MPHYADAQQNDLIAAGLDATWAPDRPAPAAPVPWGFLPPCRPAPVRAVAPADDRADRAEAADDDVVVDLRPQHVRTVHVVDTENLLGGDLHDATVEQIRALVEDYRRLVGAREDDLFFFGANPALKFRVMLATGSNQVRGYGGKDGADLALLDVVDDAWVVGQFDRVCVASGDHAFAPLARTLKEQGLHVTVVSRPLSVAAELYSAASEHLVLPPALAAA